MVLDRVVEVLSRSLVFNSSDVFCRNYIETSVTTFSLLPEDIV